MTPNQKLELAQKVNDILSGVDRDDAAEVLLLAFKSQVPFGNQPSTTVDGPIRRYPF